MKKVFFISMMIAFSSTILAQYREVRLPEKHPTPSYKNYGMDASPFWFPVEAEGATSIMEKSKNMQYVNFSLTAGYRFCEYLRVGAGFGGRMYFSHYEVRGTDRQFGVPIFANARGNFISSYDRDGVPFWSVNVGGITNEGVYFNPTIGYSFGGMRNNFLVGLSYSLTSFKDYDGETNNYSSIGIKIGYEF